VPSGPKVKSSPVTTYEGGRPIWAEDYQAGGDTSGRLQLWLQFVPVRVWLFPSDHRAELRRRAGANLGERSLASLNLAPRKGVRVRIPSRAPCLTCGV